jgi:hypothetical protein
MFRIRGIKYGVAAIFFNYFLLTIISELHNGFLSTILLFIPVSFWILFYIRNRKYSYQGKNEFLQTHSFVFGVGIFFSFFIICFLPIHSILELGFFMSFLSFQALCFYVGFIRPFGKSRRNKSLV